MSRPIQSRRKWRIRPLDVTGQRRSMTFDTKREAWDALRKFEGEVVEIKRGERDPRPPDRTFADLCDYWLEHRIRAKRSGPDQVSIIRRHLLPTFGHLRLTELTAEHVDPFVAARDHLSQKTLANHLTLLISMLNAAKDGLRWIREVPKIQKPKIRWDDEQFRYLKSHEIPRFLSAAREEDEHVHCFFAVAIYTGMRAGEIAGLRWADIDFDAREIRVARSFDGPTKSGKVRTVPLLNILAPTLRTWRLRNPGDLVFTNRDGRMFGASARIFQEVLHRVLRRGGFEPPPDGRLPELYPLPRPSAHFRCAVGQARRRHLQAATHPRSPEHCDDNALRAPRSRRVQERP